MKRIAEKNVIASSVWYRKQHVYTFCSTPFLISSLFLSLDSVFPYSSSVQNVPVNQRNEWVEAKEERKCAIKLSYIRCTWFFFHTVLLAELLKQRWVLYCCFKTMTKVYFCKHLVIMNKLWKKCARIECSYTIFRWQTYPCYRYGCFCFRMLYTF